MDLCNCCTSAHQDIPLILDLCSIGSSTELLTDDIIAGLGETSLNWFDELTEGYLADQQKKNGESNMPADDSVGWSPCPRGGLFSFQGDHSKPDPATPITALLSLSDTSKDFQVHRSPTSSKHLEYLCTGQLDIKWTSAMATPQRSENTSVSSDMLCDDDTSAVTTNLCGVKPKVFHRQLFSPGAASACDDSLTQILEACGDVDITVESERTFVNEDEFESTFVSSIITPPGFCDRGNGAYKHSTPLAVVVDSVAGKDGSRTRKEIVFQQKSTEGSACAGSAANVDQYFEESLSLSTADMDVIDQGMPNDENVSDHLAATAVNDLSGSIYMPESKHIEDSLLLRKSSKRSRRLTSKSHIEVVLSEIFPSQASPRSLEGESFNPDISEKQKIGAMNADPCASEDQEGGILREDLHNADPCASEDQEGGIFREDLHNLDPWASEDQEGAVLKADLHSSREHMGRAELDLGSSPVQEKVVFEENDSGRKVEEKMAIAKCGQSLCQDKGAEIMDLSLCQQRVKNTSTAGDCAEEEETMLAGTSMCRQRANLDILGTYSSRYINGQVSVKQVETTCDRILCLESDFAVEDNQLRPGPENIETAAGSNRVSRKRRRIDLGESSKRGVPFRDQLGSEWVESLSCQQSIATQCVSDIQESFHESTSYVESLKNSVENPIILRSILKSSDKRKATTRRVTFNLAMNSSLRFMKKTPKCLEFADGDSYRLHTDRTTSCTDSSCDMLDFCEKECHELLSLSGSSDIVVRNDTCSTSIDTSHNSHDNSSRVDLSLSVLENGCSSMTNDQDDSQNNSLTSSQIEEDALRDECPHFQYPLSRDSDSQAKLQVVKSLTSADTHSAEPMLVEENIDGYGFDDSFQVSPTFCSQILRCSQTVAHDELPAVAALCGSDINVQDVPIQHSCDVATGVLGTSSHDVSSVHDRLSSVHNPDLCSVNDAHYVGCHGDGGYKSVEKVSDHKGEVEGHSVGNVSDFSLDDGDDEMVCAAALQAETADGIQQVWGVEKKICKENELDVSGVTGVVGERVQAELDMCGAKEVVGDSYQAQLDVSGVTGVVGERVQAELDMCGAKEVVGDSYQAELEVSGVKDSVNEVSQYEMFACRVILPVDVTSMRLPVSCHATLSVAPLLSSSSLLTTTLVLSAASRTTTAESLVSSSSFEASVSLTSVPLKTSSTASGTLASTVLIASSSSSLLMTPPPSAFTATSPAVIAPPTSVLIAQSSPCTAMSPCTAVSPCTALSPSASPSTRSSVTSPSTSASTTQLASTTILASTTTLASTTQSASTTTSASTSTSASTTPAAPSEITAKSPVATSDFPSGPSSLHIFHRRQKKFLYPHLKQTTPETLSIEEETASSSAGRTSFSAQEPVGDVGRETNMNPGMAVLKEPTHPASMLRELSVRSSRAAGKIAGQSAESGNAGLGPPRRTGQLLGFAKFSDVFQMSNDKSTCDMSLTSNTVPPPVVTAVTVADINNQSKAREKPCLSSTELPCDINTARHVTRKLISGIPSQHAENRECLHHGSVDSPADSRHLKQIVVQTFATCGCTSQSDSACETDMLKQNSPGNSVFDQSATVIAGSSSYVKDEEDIGITSQMWSRTEFSQMQAGMSDNETDGWDSEDSILEHAQYLGSEPPLDSSSQVKVIHSQASHGQSLCVASSVHLGELPPTEQSSYGQIRSECHPESHTSQAVLNHSQLQRVHSGEDNLEAHLDNIFQGLKHQLKSQKPFVVPFLSKKNSGKSSSTPYWKLAEHGHLKVSTSDDFLMQKRSDVCMEDDACADLGAGSNISSKQMNNVPVVKSEHMDTLRENVHMSSAFDTNGVCADTVVIDPKPGLSCGAQGFSTASGKAICISENAKHQALKLLQDSIASNELDDLKDRGECSEGCVNPVGECVSSLCVTPVQEPSSGCAAEKVACVTRPERDINSGPLMTEEVQMISGYSTIANVSSSSCPVTPSSLCVASASSSSASSAMSLTSGNLSLMPADMSMTSGSKCMPDLTDVGRRNLVSKLSLGPKLPSVALVSGDISSSVSPGGTASAVMTSAGFADDHTGNRGVSRLDKSYKGFNPFKPPRLSHISKKRSAQESLKLKESLKQRLSPIYLEEPKNCVDNILDVTQKAQESENAHVNDNKLVDDWEDDSSFRELILVDGATDCGASNGELHGTHVDVCCDSVVIEVSNMSDSCLHLSRLGHASDANTGLGITAKGSDTMMFPKEEDKTQMFHGKEYGNIITAHSDDDNCVINGSLIDMCNDDAFRALLDTSTNSSSTLPQQQPQDGNAGPMVPIVSHNQEQRGQEKPQMLLTDGHDDFKTSYSSSTCHLIWQPQIPVQQSQDKKSVNFVDSSCLRETISQKDVYNCVDNDNFCTETLKGFVTARGATVSVSESALLEAKKMLCTEESAENLPSLCVFEDKMLPATSFTHRPKESAIHHGGDQPAGVRWHRKGVDEEVMSTDSSLSATSNCPDGFVKDVRGHQLPFSSNTADLKVAGGLASETHAKTEMDSSTVTMASGDGIEVCCSQSTVTMAPGDGIEVCCSQSTVTMAPGDGIEVCCSQCTVITPEQNERIEHETTQDHPSIGPSCKQRCFSSERCGTSRYSSTSVHHVPDDPSPEVLSDSSAYNEVETPLQNLNDSSTLCEEQRETGNKTRSSHILASSSTASGLHGSISTSASGLHGPISTSASGLHGPISTSASGLHGPISTSASGLHGPISKTALKDAASFLNETGKTSNKTRSSVILSDLSVASELRLSVTENVSKKARNFLEEFGAANGVKEVVNEFSAAASGSIISVTETALQHAHSLDDAGDVKDVMPVFSVGFSTARGSKVSVSEKALQHAKSFLGDAGDAGNAKDLIPTMSVGFSTAGGSKVSVSEKALQHANSFLGNAGDVRDVVPTMSVGFSTAGGSKVSVSEKALQHAKSFLGDAGDAGDVRDVVPTMSVGFSTAGGSKVSVSEKALQHAKSFLGDAGDAGDVRDVVPTMSVGFSTAGGSKVSVSEKALQHAKSFLGDAGDVRDVVPTMSVGFSTAGGSKVSVSEKALQHAKSFLTDGDQTLDSATQKLDMQPRATSSGALPNSGKLMQCHERFTGKTHDNELTSASSMANLRPHAAGRLLQNVQNKYSNTLNQATKENGGNSPQTLNSGFSTANGLKMYVSEDALKGAKDVLDGAEDSDSSFKAEASNSFKVPNKSLQNCDRLVKPVCAGASFASSLSYRQLTKKGLVTASSSSVVSDQAMGEDIHGNSAKDVSSNKDTNSVGNLNSSLCQTPPVCATRSSLSIGARTDHTSRYQNHLTSAQTKGTIASEGGPAPQVSTEPKLTSGFYFDRRKTKGRSLNAVLSKPFSCMESKTVLPAPAMSIFQPPDKKTKMCDDSSCKSTTTNSSATVTCSTSRSGTLTSNARSTSSFVSPSSAPPSKMMSHGKTLDSSDRSQHDLSYKKAALETTAELGHSNEQSLCEDSSSGRFHSFVDGPNWSGTVNDAVTGPSNFPDSNPSLNVAPGAVLVSQCSFIRHQPKTISDSTSHNDTGHHNYIPFELMLDESRMKQDAIIRKKHKMTVRPVCGRWLEFRKRKEALKTFQSLGLTPEAGLAREELLNHGLSDSCLGVSCLNAGNFRFDLRRFYPCLDASVLLGDGALLVPDKHGFSGAGEFYRALLTLDGVDSKLVDEAWVQNHYWWIVWKLAAYEVCFPGVFAGRSLTPEIVMLQLKYRYDREIDGCHRSAIKKILERDDTPCKRLIMCVASVTKMLNGQFSVELTDGWYVIPGRLDDCLTQHVARNRIRPGDKIVTSGAELIGCVDGCSPLELKEGTMLKLHGNSTRPAPWHSRLGYCFPPSALCVPLRTLSPTGGLASCVDVVFCRRYPVMYMEKLQDCSSVFRTAEEEDRARQRHEDWFQMEGEKMYMSLQTEMEGNIRGCRPGHGKKCHKDIKSLWSGQDLASALEDALNPEELQQSLSSSQMDRLVKYREAEIDRRQQEITRRLQETMADTCKPRHVTPVVKFKVHGCCRSDVDSRSSCHLVVWRPGSEWMEVEEGKRYQLFNVSVSSGRGRSEHGKVALTATRQTRIQACPINDNLLDIVYSQRDAWTVSELLSGHPFEDEFDFVGVVIQVVAPLRSTGPTSVFAADKNRDILCIRFWASSLSASLRPGQGFVASNLILSRSLQHSGCRSGQVSADARSGVTCVSTSARPSSRYSDQLTQVHNLSKTKGFLSDLQTKLQVRGYTADTKQNIPGHLTSRHEDYHEDFPPEIVDKIFTPMSQEGPDTGRQTTLLDLWNQKSPVNKQSLTVPCSSYKQGSGPGKPQQSSDSLVRCSSFVNTASTAFTNPVTNSGPSTKNNTPHGQSTLKDTHWPGEINQGDVESEKNKSLKRKHEDEELENSFSLDMTSKRKSILRAKMSKLLAYERPSKLSPLSCGNSPASSREFKSPIAKKL